MGDQQYENDYLERKKRLRVLHQKLKDTKEVQEIYHKIMGSSQGEMDSDTEDPKSK
ncbi:MAG: hypothetical protein PF569_07100 [Candidatus Woesearchaeota archaeon]|jgi:hypothetical protein|nr:hypothetical protein [Candidatus Woesearchaeota archaeon]